ncbi:helix-turn-helix domain-containing protein [Streptomyces megasporus]|uniref:helix-turn-helix domain-containing protein n=1 Tax=Streptomyces megasporus TaxID=44060 RepID=UPI0004E199EE|nr:AraC family transcriptional regulator [Streptomyces megasporus]
MSSAPLSKTCRDRPALWLWPGQALYVGPSLELDVHAGTVSCLAVGVDAEFTVHLEDGTRHTARTALVAARVRHRITTHGERMAFCYLDPASARERACRLMTAGGSPELALAHRHGHRLARLAATMDGGTPAATARRWLDLAGPDDRAHAPDPRIRKVTRRMTEDAGQRLPAAELAAEAGLSVSAFLRLFREQTGTTFRRYRLWARMLRVAALLDTRPDLSTAAVEAGFAGPSHFSSSFHAMFGFRPSRLLSQGVTITAA